MGVSIEGHIKRDREPQGSRSKLAGCTLSAGMHGYTGCHFGYLSTVLVRIYSHLMNMTMILPQHHIVSNFFTSRKVSSCKVCAHC